MDNEAFGFVHKAFGNKRSNLKKLLAKLHARPSGPPTSIIVSVYGSCGPCRYPRRPKGLFRLVLNDLTIGQLNKALERGNLRAVNALRREYRSIRSYLPSRSGTNYIFHPELEDNLTDRAHRTARLIALTVFADRPDVVVGRNPRQFKQADYPIETHSFEDLSKLKSGDLLVGDGELILFPGETCATESYTEQEIAQLVSSASDAGVHVMLWRPEHQGLPRCLSGSMKSLVRPSKRVYTITKSSELVNILKE